MASEKRYYARKTPVGFIPYSQNAKVFIGKRVIEVISIERQYRTNKINRYKKIAGGQYVDTETGEIHKNHSVTNRRDERQRGLQKSFITLRRIVNLNFHMTPNEKHVVLTYGHEMLSYEQACLDFKNFWARFHYVYTQCEYVRVVEPQQNGTWHIHVLVKQMDGKKLFVPTDTLSKMWGHGFVKILPMPIVDNYGAYFSARLTDLYTEDTDELMDEIVSLKPSTRLKGQRLHFYPPNYRLYACSRGIARPEPKLMTYGEAMNLVTHEKPAYGYTNEIVCIQEGEEPLVVNRISYEQYILGRYKKTN